ncbi:MAG TPA: hypothetical protein VNK06_01400 [Thermodesulfobacteriota bacterium]|nr:hypothetical protein [Thermodesulfobacteriota bacterium]
METTEGSFKAVIPTKENKLLRFLCIIVVMLLTTGGISVISYIYHGKASSNLFGTMLWLLCWFFIDFYFLYALLWNLAGREIIRFDGRELTVKYDIEGFGRTRRLSAESISEVGVDRAKGLNELFGISGGAVRVVWEGEPHWFGIDLSDEEALEIAGEIKRLLRR